MNRTTVYLGLAAALLVVALIVGLPKVNTVAPEPGPVTAPAPLPPSPVAPSPAPVAPHPGSLSLTGKLSHPYVTPGTSDVFASLDVSAVALPNAQRAPVNLALVIDRSGSMSGSKLAEAKRAALRLVEMLNSDDRLAVVHFGNDVRVFPGAAATDDNRQRMRHFISNIWDEGGTNIGEALQVGKAQLERAHSEYKVNRLLLLTDGQPTVGVTSLAGLTRIAAQVRAAGVTITSLGVGADFNEDLMQRLADVGGGSYGFISSGASVVAIFETDLRQAATMVARNVSLTFTLPEAVELREVFGRPVSQQGRQVTVSLPDFSASQSEKVVVHLTATPRGTPESVLDIADFRLAYHDLLTNQPADGSLKLSALVTNDHRLAEARREKEAFVSGTRAQAAVNYRKAAELMEQGDFGAATRTLEANQALFDQAAAVGGVAAVEEDQKQNAYYFGLSTRPAAAPEQRREDVKALKKQSLKSAGRGASVY